MNRQPYIYILANKYHGTLYIGVTNNLIRRIWEHKNNVVPGFTRKYCVHKLVYYEYFETMYDAISREKQLKAGSRKRKIALIESTNPGWRDLYSDICH